MSSLAPMSSRLPGRVRAQAECLGARVSHRPLGRVNRGWFSRRAPAALTRIRRVGAPRARPACGAGTTCAHYDPPVAEPIRAADVESQRDGLALLLRRRPLDDLDRQLIERLQDDGRRSVVDLARDLATTTKTVRRRMERLLEGGVIQVTA